MSSLRQKSMHRQNFGVWAARTFTLLLRKIAPKTLRQGVKTNSALNSQLSFIKFYGTDKLARHSSLVQFINASFCSGIKLVHRAAEKADAEAGELPTCSPVKRIRNCRADTASSLETEAVVAPCASKCFGCKQQGEPVQMKTW